MTHPPIAMQLNVFGRKYKPMDEHGAEILDGVVSAGFTAVEGCAAKDQTVWNQMLRDRGLRYTAGHLVPAALDDDAKVEK